MIKLYQKNDMATRIKLFYEDNLALMRRYPDFYFDLAIVDPPYGINAPNLPMGSAPNRLKGGEHQSGPSTSTAIKLKKGRLNSGGGALKNRSLQTMNISWDNEIPSPEYFQELFRVSRNQIIWGGNYFPLPPTRCVLCWDKMQPWDNFSQWEMAWTSFDEPAALIRISNTGGANLEKKISPTQKPVKLYTWQLKKFAKKHFKILDTNLGSGSSAIAADLFEVAEFVGCDNDLQMFNDASDRIERVTNFKKHNRETTQNTLWT